MNSVKTYNGVEFCDLSAYDKERVNQGILLEDEEIGNDLCGDTMEMADPDGPGLSLEN